MNNKRFLKKFNSQSDYESQKDSVMGIPHVVLFDDTKELLYASVDYSKEYFTIVNTSEEPLTIQLKQNKTVQTLNYKLSTSNDWESSTSVTVNASEEVQLKGNYAPITSYGIGTFKINGGTFDVKGNVMSLLFDDNFVEQTSLEEYPSAFCMLFYNCMTLTNANELILPATTLSIECYAYMFFDCTNLTTAFELPATTLANNCYQYMFGNCTNLTTAFELPATTLTNECYSYMFNGCTNLTTAPELPATILADYCYNGMFSDCTSLTTAPELPATTLAISCYVTMFNGCSSLITAPELLATTLVDYCYSGMFGGCTSLTTAPELLATTLTSECYSYMFQGCTNLTTAPELPATTLADYCYYYMFDSCTNLTTAPELQATTLVDYCYFGMFNGCTSLTTEPELPATTLADGCYGCMFNGCTNLTTAPELPATTLANECYNYMFRDCTNLTTAPQLPSTTLADYCYSEMFYGCTSLTTAPELPATTLADFCYSSMFSGCTSLTTVPKELPATTLKYCCYSNMFESCTSLTTAPKLPATILTKYCYEYMFQGCSKLNNITMLATDISAKDCLNNWVNDVSSNGTFIKRPLMTTLPNGVSGIPNGWTVENYDIITPNDPFNDYEYVDLGLPSGTLWATSVIGGDNPLYFQWGDTEGWTAEQINNGEKAFAGDGSDYKWNDSSTGTYTKYNATDGKTVLDLEDDAAHVHMGGDWHMPTKEQLEELSANTTSTWTTQNGVNGRLFTSTINGNSVFVPACGNADLDGLVNVGYACYVWSSSIGNDGLYDAWYLRFNSSVVYVYDYSRTCGHCVLGVVG